MPSTHNPVCELKDPEHRRYPDIHIIAIKRQELHYAEPKVKDTRLKIGDILLLPIAITAAQSLGVDPRPFIIAVCFGASACFATPIGYQTNLLVYGPGGYRFSDYLKLGIPLNLLVLVLGSLFIPLIWPF